jgi:sugar lactone lactonase YvrE
LAALTSISIVMTAWNPIPAGAWERGSAEIFAVLPDGATGPEGLTVGRDGKVYVTTFGFNASGPQAGPGQLYVFSHGGRLVRQVSVAGSSPNLLGLAFHPTTHALLVIDSGAGQVLKVDPQSGASSVFMTAADIDPDPNVGPGLNALAFDQVGNVYVSDSFQGVIWKTGAAGGAGVQWVTDALLKTTGTPPFGANGLKFNKDGSALFVANTGDDRIIKIPVSGGTPGTPEIFVNSINGADGLVIDRHDNIWVAANQADEIVVLDPTGKVIAKLGDFEGIKKPGLPRGLLFPASLDFTKHGNFLYVTNLALDLRLFGLPQAVDSQWTAKVKRYTISKIPTNVRGPHR